MIEAVTDPEQFARRLNLRYVRDDEPGGTRRRCGRGFQFLDHQGEPIADDEERGRIRSLAIPPAWRSVWICCDQRGHVQATGRDARDRKQYRYHTRWTESANLAKFDRLIAFGERLPALRRRVRADLKRPGLDRRRVLATVVRILDRGFLRLGHDAYTAKNETFGATTLRTRHVQVEGDHLEVSFIGKHHVDRTVELDDPLLAGVVSELSQTARRRLFRYRQNGVWHDVRAAMVNDYLGSVCDDGVTAKWFRTWHGSRLMLETLQAAARQFDTPRKRHVDKAVRFVAENLGNRPATARKFYIDPSLSKRYLDGQLPLEPSQRTRGLRKSESLLLELLASRG